MGTMKKVTICTDNGDIRWDFERAGYNTIPSKMGIGMSHEFAIFAESADPIDKVESKDFTIFWSEAV